MIKVGIIGSTGYAGQQLVWLLHRHRETKIVFLSSYNYAGLPFSNVYPEYYQFIQDLCIDIHTVEKKLSSIDLLFIALPHGKSFAITKKALDLGVKVIDLGADFRLKNTTTYKKWYGLNHELPEFLSTSVYGLPEINKKDIKKANLIANPGCYPTASILALAPLLKHKIIDPNSIIIDAKSGVSGAGRKANVATLFAECNESIKAYGVGCHRHTPEIEQEVSNIYGQDILLSFTPHLIPMNRGILATCYGSLVEKISQEDLYKIYEDFYKDGYFIRIRKEIPQTKWVKGTNLCDIGICIDERTDRVIIVSAIDNLIKGAAGQAIQNMNIMFDIEETEGLKFISMTP
ncbi:N-acetyl-gamma-glutamyl-phosphate reductase [Crassaminicella thermophila]|uniref:N-acetyl-gamma-glutamyl-phosphate reductase n=1 Tax=Crassaminicella thermophila TaxID=2599308 RepID=A0A5C0SAB7_CRATE|nr:N-acetyl-gamma-glutamyl-phosphate reductase [Crassaminicella thermophila]QEK10940.1 N-acetyl-gamma-glutamyl-phosphate reductase [Crassaminicella thermophila]